MACLIKAPQENSKGLLTLTTQERDLLVFRHQDVHQLLSRLKDRYVIGMHHNWHDYSLRYDDLFDFHLAGEKDLREASGRNIPLVPMDACNFSPPCFQPIAGTEKFWDVLFVARAVEFKGIPEFFLAIRSLFDKGHMLRVLFICPIPPKAGAGVIQNVRALYESMFHGVEQERFTLLTTDFRYPFPFDLPTLAYFYRASRIFVHSAPDERRCRVAAYAWASGLPVVGMECVGSILTTELQHSPYFFKIDSYEEFPEQILRAMTAVAAETDFSMVQAEVRSEQSVERFERHIARIFSEIKMPQPPLGGWLHGLDIRLGRHHGLPAGVNQVDHDIVAFLKLLLEGSPAVMADLARCEDPELEIARREPCAPRPLKGLPLRKRLKNSAISLLHAAVERVRT